MKPLQLSLLTFSIVTIAACSARKGTTSSVPAATTSPGTNTSSGTNFVMLKPNDGIYEPGENELKAIQAQYTDVTLDKLKEGHFIYTKGACINCHETASIYSRDVVQWKDIIDDMARKAQLSDVQKDAVYKYVLAIKATQPK